MARRQPSSARRGRKQSKTNPLPFILGGLALLAVVVAFAVSGGDDKEENSTDQNQAKKSASLASKTKSSTSTPAKKKGKLINGKTKSEWRELRKKFDMTLWREVESEMAVAMKKRAEALTVRKTGNEKKYKELMTKAVKFWGTANAKSEDVYYRANQIDEEFWDSAFDRESRQLQTWTKAFRGYTGFGK